MVFIKENIKTLGLFFSTANSIFGDKQWLMNLD